MSQLFANLNTDGLEKPKDTLGGGFSVLSTDVYPAVIKAFFAGKAASGAQFVTVIATVTVDGAEREYREDIYVTNKKGENWFLNKQDTSKKVPLPGFTLTNNIAMLTAETTIDQLVFEERTFKLWDKEAGKEVPKAVPTAIDVIGKPILLAIEQSLEDKTVKDAQGVYVPTGETRDNNSIAHVFHHEAKCTVNEAMEELEPVFMEKWLEKNKGVVRDRTKKTAGAKAGAPSASGAPAPVKKSLFGNKG